MDTRTPGCYYDAASSIKDNRITQLEFFQQCLAHLGPEDTRSRHPEDEGPIRDLLNPLFWRGAFGPVAAAIKLCESDPQALSIDGTVLFMRLVLIFAYKVDFIPCYES